MMIALLAAAVMILTIQKKVRIAAAFLRAIPSVSTAILTTMARQLRHGTMTAAMKSHSLTGIEQSLVSTVPYLRQSMSAIAN